MIELDVQQGSPEWLRARLGIPTASQFSRLITPKQLKPSAQAKTYLAELVAEWMIGKPVNEHDSEFMQRGTALETKAKQRYELDRGMDLRKVGFVFRDDRWVGCSPDALVGNDGGLEIKCPSPAVHAEYLLDAALPDDYMPQVHGCIWLCEREWWDVMSYHPDMDPVIVRVERNDDYIDKLADAVNIFVDKLQAVLKQHGYLKDKKYAL